MPNLRFFKGREIVTTDEACRLTDTPLQLTSALPVFPRFSLCFPQFSKQHLHGSLVPRKSLRTLTTLTDD